MAKEKPPEPDSSGDIPDWFMTYSDVITLLMTFFILLLTFASNEPEQFERMKTTMFSATGGTGIAGKKTAGIEKESFVVRMRPRAARVSMRGSEMPPTQEDPKTEDVSSTLAGLDDDEMRNLTPRSSIDLPLSFLLEDDMQTVSAVGQQHLKMMARQVHRPGNHVVFAINANDDAAPLFVISKYLMSLGIKPGKIAFSTTAKLKSGSNRVRLEIVREERG